MVVGLNSYHHISQVELHLEYSPYLGSTFVSICQAAGACKCTTAMQSLCDRAKQASSGNCLICVGQHQQPLAAVGCAEEDLQAFCDGRSRQLQLKVDDDQNPMDEVSGSEMAVRLGASP